MNSWLLKSIIKFNFVIFGIIMMLTGCTIPQIAELKAIPPNEVFIIKAPLNCLYDKGVEHVSSYIGMMEPQFTWYIKSNYSYAWFRQPLTLIELQMKSENTTQVSRSQTNSAKAFEQGNNLIIFLKANPCNNTSEVEK